jgi:hypothetical protein
VSEERPQTVGEFMAELRAKRERMLDEREAEVRRIVAQVKEQENDGTP